MSNDTSTYSEMIDGIESLSDEDLAKELSFAEGFGPSETDESVNVWLEALRHESRCRGVFVPSEDFEDIDDWMEDSDYLYCDGSGDECDEECGWVDHADQPVNASEVYAEAHQSMTWSDALDAVLQA